jgi:hypothetical protein
MQPLPMSKRRRASQIASRAVKFDEEGQALVRKRFVSFPNDQGQALVRKCFVLFPNDQLVDIIQRIWKGRRHALS